jgi:hypothetical protein
MAIALSFSIVDRTPGGAALLTSPGGVGLYREAIELGFGAEVAKGFTARVMLRGVSVRIGANGDRFLEQLVPGAQDSQAFDLGLAWDSQRGLSFAGGAALEATLPLRAKLPLVSLDALHLGLKAPGDSGADFALSLSADLTGSLVGLIEVSVERIGLEVLGWYAGNANPKFLSIDPDKGQYAGLLSLNLIGLGVTAIGIVNTKPAFSLLAVITANFRPVGLDIGCPRTCCLATS